MSAQDIAKMALPAAAGTDTADQVCARFSAGSATTAPPELESQNGVLEVTMKFLTVNRFTGAGSLLLRDGYGLTSADPPGEPGRSVNHSFPE